MPVNFFSKEDKEILDKLAVSNEDEMVYWKLPNMFFPLSVIIISLICYVVFKPEEAKTFTGWLNILFNGSLPMVALNRMSTLGTNLFKFDISKEKSYNKNTVGIRTKIFNYCMILAFFIALFYVFQVIQGPFEVSFWLIVQLIISIFLIYHALNLSKYAYLLQEKFLERTYGDEVRETVKESRRNLSDKYGDV